MDESLASKQAARERNFRCNFRAKHARKEKEEDEDEQEEEKEEKKAGRKKLFDAGSEAFRQCTIDRRWIRVYSI